MNEITYRIIPRRCTLLVFERGPGHRPDSSLQISLMGDRAVIDSLMGAGFYRLMGEVGIKPFQEMGIAHVYAAVTDVHLRLLCERMPLVHVERIGPITVDGIPMNWVEITASGEAGAHVTPSNFATL